VGCENYPSRRKEFRLAPVVHARLGLEAEREMGLPLSPSRARCAWKEEKIPFAFAARRVLVEESDLPPSAVRTDLGAGASGPEKRTA